MFHLKTQNTNNNTKFYNNVSHTVLTLTPLLYILNQRPFANWIDTILYQLVYYFSTFKERKSSHNASFVN